ncbi:hypothetical protein HDU97_002480, partial [Phlyctochytrium planicorne]
MEDVAVGDRSVVPLESLRIVHPLAVEPTKPRKCDDCTFLNLWMAALPFTLEGVQSLTYWSSRLGMVVDIKS